MTQSFNEQILALEIAGSHMEVIQAGQGEPVILAHSYLWDADMWRAQIRTLSQHYQVFAPNLWGHGGSGAMPAGTLDLRDIAQQHLQLIDRLGLTRFSLVGHSLGGMWGAQLALLVPHRVRALALIDSCLKPEPALPRQRYFAMLDIVEVARAVPEAVAREVLALFFSPGMQEREPEVVERFRERIAGWDVERLLDSVVPLGRMTFGREDSLVAVSRLSLPKLVMHGTADIPRPFEEARHMADVLDCRFIALTGAGHMVPLEVPEAVAQGLLNFLEGVHRLDAVGR